MEISESIRLGPIEFLAMNNPLRNWRMKHQEFPLLLQMLGKQNIVFGNPVFTDMGCGSGYSTQLLQEFFRPGKIYAFDLMPEQIALARGRGLNIEFQVADALAMPVETGVCDAVFDFGILHHIPSWFQVLEEAERVLVPGGILFIEEPHKLFEWDALEEGIIRSGFKILENRQWYRGSFRFYLAQKTEGKYDR